MLNQSSPASPWQPCWPFQLMPRSFQRCTMPCRSSTRTGNQGRRLQRLGAGRIHRCRWPAEGLERRYRQGDCGSARRSFTFEGTSFDAIIPGLMAKRFDAGFSSFGTTAERLKTIDFVSQRKIGTSLAYPASSALDIKETSQVCGLTVAVLNGSWDLELMEKLNANDCKDKPVVVQTHGTQAQAELAVRSNRAQATAAASVKLAYMAKQTGDMKVSELVLAAVNSCIGVRKGDPLGQVMTDAISR